MRLILPPVLKDVGMGVGHHLTLEVTADSKIVMTRKHKYVLADMISQCDLKAEPPAGLAQWDAVRPVGDEFL